MSAQHVLSGVSSLPLGRGGSFWFPPQASSVAGGHDFVYDLILWLCVIFFVAICGATIYFMIKYRKRPGHKEEITSTHNTRLEVTWSVVPLLLLMVVFGVSTYWYMEMITPPEDDVYELNVEASKWKWRFRYSGEPFQKSFSTKKLYLIKDRAYQMVMTAPDNDVIHSMFVPAFRMKQDCVPGRYNRLWFRPTMTGEFDLYCTEYCGDNHSNMVTSVVVFETEEEWRTAVETEYDPETYSIEDLGQVIYDDNCKLCHTLDGSALTGPSFQGFGERWGTQRELADGRTREVDENYVKDSLVNPGKDIVAGYNNAMTPFAALTPREVEAIIEYLRKQ